MEMKYLCFYNVFNLPLLPASTKIKNTKINSPYRNTLRSIFVASSLTLELCNETVKNMCDNLYFLSRKIYREFRALVRNLTYLHLKNG